MARETEHSVRMVKRDPAQASMADRLCREEQRLMKRVAERRRVVADELLMKAVRNAALGSPEATAGFGGPVPS
jgi:hypothetical protein